MEIIIPLKQNQYNNEISIDLLMTCLDDITPLVKKRLFQYYEIYYSIPTSELNDIYDHVIYIKDTYIAPAQQLGFYFKSAQLFNGGLSIRLTFMEEIK